MINAQHRTRTGHAPRETDPPFISVIVPVRNEANTLGSTLAQLLGQDYDPARFEVIVVDGGSTDGTPEAVHRLRPHHPNLALLGNPRRLSSAARNVGVWHARGDLIVIVDGHCEVRDPYYLRELASAFARSDADCVGRPQPLDVTGATTLQRAIAAARSSWLGHHLASFIYSDAEQFVPPQSVAVAYRRSVFGAVGFFDERFDACEDVEFNHRVDRAGLRCFFTPNVRVHYHPRSTLRGLFGQMARYGRGRIRLARKHPAARSFAVTVPALFVAGLAAGPPLAWLSPWAASAFTAGLTLYACTVLAVSLVIGLRRGNLLLLPWLPLTFVTIHVGAGYGALEEWLCGRPRTPGARRRVGTSS
jgi:succinoglycan biosynthesis protein ExoA